MKTQALASSTGLLAAFAASLCCIVPLLAIVSGTAGALSGLSWLTPFRPYLVGASVLALGAAWYVHLKPAGQTDDCGCPPDESNGSVLRSRGFLGVVTVLAIVLLAVPLVTPPTEPVTVRATTAAPTQDERLMAATFLVEGMTCGGCEKHVSDAVYGVAGVIEIRASYAEKNTVVIYDAQQTDPEKIAAAIATTGYTVTDYTTTETTSRTI
jgi:copper chaperone CopZ